MDDEFNREDRSRSHVEAIFAGRPFVYESISALKQPHSSVTDMPPWSSPSTGHFDGLPNGVMVAMRDLNVPIHQDARARITVSIPKYLTTNASNWPDLRPWSAGNFTLVVTVLEEISG